MVIINGEKGGALKRETLVFREAIFWKISNFNCKIFWVRPGARTPFSLNPPCPLFYSIFIHLPVTWKYV